MAEPWKPCPVCGWHEAPSIDEGVSYRYRVTTCNDCGWGVETRVKYRDGMETIRDRCMADWNDRRTWKERQNG